MKFILFIVLLAISTTAHSNVPSFVNKGEF